MRVKISRWGNSTAVRIPQTLVDRLKLVPGDEMEIDVRDNVLELVFSRKPSRMTLDEMVAEMERLGPDNAPEAVDWGAPRGLEIIDDDYSRGIITPETMERDYLARGAK